MGQGKKLYPKWSLLVMFVVCVFLWFGFNESTNRKGQVYCCSRKSTDVCLRPLSQLLFARPFPFGRDRQKTSPHSHPHRRRLSAQTGPPPCRRVFPVVFRGAGCRRVLGVPSICILSRDPNLFRKPSKTQKKKEENKTTGGV